MRAGDTSFSPLSPGVRLSSGQFAPSRCFSDPECLGPVCTRPLSVFPQGLLEEPDWSVQSPPLVMCPPPPWSLRGSSTWPTKPPGLTAASWASPPSPASCAVPP
ncbi:hypothetical protein H1C71_042637, partial [Ictidomys tridecemlineatus]